MVVRSWFVGTCCEGTPLIVPPPLPATAAKTYIVMPGNSLSGIAQKLYGSGAQWPKIYQANKSLIGPNPNQLKLGLKLTIP